MRAIQITEFGGPEVLTLTDLPEPEAVPGMSVVEVVRAGVNYADTHHVENSYLAPASLPLVPGAEVAGRTADGRRVVALVADGMPYTSFAVDDVQAEFDRLSALGVQFTQPPTEMGPVTTAVFDDTCGNLIQIAAMQA